jgi:von Willebrand factor type A domain
MTHRPAKLPRTVLMAAALALLAALVARPAAADEPKQAPAPKPKPIDVVICLDCSNSMDGLIASAKTKLWAIVNDLASAKPAPDLRVALYSYGNDTYDRKKGWVRQDVELTTDLDKVSEKLFALSTKGGTEYVARVTRDALNELKWSDDKDALKLIFVCGNEPASQDRQVTLKESAELAKSKGVVINPIYCGRSNDADARDWKEFAGLAGGRFTNIDQDGSVALATPMDKELTELSAKLNTTYLGYGAVAREKLENQFRQDANATGASPAAAPDRAMTKAGGLYRNSDWDLVDLMEKDPKFDVTKIPEDQLCDALRKLKPEERLAFVKEMSAKRKEIQKQILELGQKRQGYLKEEMKKQSDKKGQALDDALRDTIREQAAAKGLQLAK